MRRRTAWLLGTLMLLVMAMSAGNAGAEGKIRISMPVIPHFRAEQINTSSSSHGLLMGTATASLDGPESGTTGEKISFTVNNLETEVVAYYCFAVAIQDNTHADGNADAMYDESNWSNLRTEPDFQFTFYLPGTYSLYCYRYDADMKEVAWSFGGGSYPFIYSEIEIINGAGTNALQSKVAEVAAACARGDDYSTALAIHDWLADHVTYDYTYTWYTPDSALLQGKTVCNGYARAYAMIGEAAGLAVRRVTGTVASGGHAWNAVRMDGNWYYVDPTWDDSDDDEVSHRYFGMNRVIMDYDHQITNVVGGSVECTELADSYYIRSGTWQNLAQNAMKRMETMVAARAHLFEEVSMGTEAYTEFEGMYYMFNDSQRFANGHVTAYQFSHMKWTCAQTGETFSGSFTYDDRSNTISGSFKANGTLQLPMNLESIEEYAFAGTDAYYAIIPDGCLSIGANAFADRRLWEITIPDSVTQIDPTAFDGTIGLVIRTTAGSTAAQMGDALELMVRTE